MKGLINRWMLAIRILFGSRVLVIEKKFDEKRRKDKVTLWGSIDSNVEQTVTLYKMADSLFSELTAEELDKFHTLQYPKQ